jgi:hypothetical protein
LISLSFKKEDEKSIPCKIVSIIRFSRRETCFRELCERKSQVRSPAVHAPGWDDANIAALLTSPFFNKMKTMIADEILIPQPRTLDVLCGRDREAFNHDGNVHYRFLVESNRERYQTANFREEKTQISQAILDEVLR